MTKTILDNCKIIDVSEEELRGLIHDYIMSRLSEKEKNELVVKSLEHPTEDGHYTKFISLKIFLCEPEFV